MEGKKTEIELKNLEEEMLKEMGKDGFVIHKSSEKFVHGTDIDERFKKILPNYQSSIEDTVKFFEQYLNTYYITDTKFTNDDGTDNHLKRREWRHQMSAKYPMFWDFYEKNALKLNCVSGFDNYVNNLKKILGSKREIITGGQNFDDCMALLNQMPDIATYESLSLADKIKFIEKLKEIARSFLKIYYCVKD